MTASDSIKILVVDDLAEKLLVYESILLEPGVEIVAARSGAEALRRVLADEFAVILLDVNMPDMDGFETAGLIRSRKRCAHTPIIFLTAHTDELHALRGYAYGAVDYILTPVMPEILRTKVRVFVELFRLNQQVREQASRRIAVVEREQAHLTDLLERATEFVARIDVNGEILHINRGGRRVLGYGEGEEFPRSFAAHQPVGAAQTLRDTDLPAAQREGVWFGESSLCTREGLEIPVSVVILAHYTAAGEIEHFSIVARDISERRQVEAELARHRARLEDLVRERTAELKASHERLRIADRMASIGTLAAGLGHDMGNLLLPVRMRIDALERMELPDAAHEHARAIAQACEYLKRLSQGLRLFALSPEDARASGDRVNLDAWWADVAPFLRNTLPRAVLLEVDFAPNLPPIATSPHLLTQTIYNLVQNAGDALKDRAAGHVRITARRDADQPRITLEVADDGPGMTEEVLQRCMEPFFTTKARGISTGLGLALVRGAVREAGGVVEIRSRPGEGATFLLSFPIAPAPAPGGDSAAPPTAPLIACVQLRDGRLAAFVESILCNLDVRIINQPWSRDVRAAILIIDGPEDRLSELEEYLGADPRRRAVVVGGAPAGARVDRVIWLDASPPAHRVRASVTEAARMSCPQLEGAQL